MSPRWVTISNQFTCDIILYCRVEEFFSPNYESTLGLNSQIQISNQTHLCLYNTQPRLSKSDRTGRTGNRTCLWSSWCRKRYRERTGKKPRKVQKFGNSAGLNGLAVWFFFPFSNFFLTHQTWFFRKRRNFINHLTFKV
jgi:hypothetical protein